MTFLTRTVTCVFCIGMFSCNSHDSQVEWDVMGNETKIVELSQKIRLLQMRVEKGMSAAREFEAAAFSAQGLTTQVDKLRARQSELIVAIADRENDVATAKIESVQHSRLSARGRTYPTFRDSKRTYYDVTITEITDIGIQISHRDGRTRINCADLTESQIQEFGLDSELARDTLHREQQQIAAFDAAQDQALLAQREKEQKEAIAALYVPAPTVALSSKPKSASFKSTQPKSVYRVRRSSSYYYTQPTYYYSYPTPTYCPAPRYERYRSYPRVTTPLPYFP